MHVFCRVTLKFVQVRMAFSKAKCYIFWDTRVKLFLTIEDGPNLVFSAIPIKCES